MSAEQRSNGLRTMAPVENIDQRKAPAAASATPKANPAAAVAATPAAANPAWDMFQQLEGLRTTVASLQGRVEEQQQVIDRLKEDSRARYTDLDQRIGLLEQSMGPAPINPGAAAATPAAAATLADIETQKQAYLAAYQSFRSDGPAAAIGSMNAFISQYPDSVFVANAYYWLGEFHLAETPANLDAASAQFNRVIKEYEGSPKVASSYYKLGTIADLRNQRNEARQLMQTVVNRFSDSAEAGLAKSYLDQNPAEVTR
ncbi:MAG: tetratricopeptide repeat protein [Paraperlucidibaca sp.]|nr:tetratricopeptide repeat protein [Paraperlucidibaca sp.]MBQ0723204.1 tetratricopeptide repeat protein [Paraperlucidibaca sp.]MBQ0842806.1 tetratricopeptide repeat protein [Paraperlucidibaca sp.]